MTAKRPCRVSIQAKRRRKARKWALRDVNVTTSLPIRFLAAVTASFRKA